MPIGIQAIAHHLPETVVASAEIAERHGFDLGFINDKLGIAERHVARADESTADLCAAAARKVLARAGLAPEAVELVAVVTQTPDYCLPHSAALVHEALGLPKTTAAFDIGLGCSGFVYGLGAAVPMMAAHGMRTGLLIAADEYSKVMDPGDRTTAPLFGDGAAAALLTESPAYVAGAFTFGTDGARHGALIVPGSGTHAGPRGNLFMDGRAIFNFMMSEVPRDIDACLAANGLAKDDIDRWVFHQASRYLLSTLARRLGVAEERVVFDMADVGNTTSATIPIALERQVLGADPPPRRVLISGFGVGLSWASTVLTHREA